MSMKIIKSRIEELLSKEFYCSSDELNGKSTVYSVNASNAVIKLLREDGIPYITATHDKNNPRSGNVMKRIGMKYCYSYKEQWQPKNFPVIFRMY